jgi:hypothetical protein
MKLHEAELAARREDAEKRLAEAWENRELVATLMETEGLGLKVLLAADSKLPMNASSIAASVNTDIDSLAPLIVRLARFGALQEDRGLFYLTERGAMLIRNLEEAIVRTQ